MKDVKARQAVDRVVQMKRARKVERALTDQSLRKLALFWCRKPSVVVQARRWDSLCEACIPNSSGQFAIGHFVPRPRIELVTKGLEAGKRLTRVPPKSSDQSLRVFDTNAQHRSCDEAGATEPPNALENRVTHRRFTVRNTVYLTHFVVANL